MQLKRTLPLIAAMAVALAPNVAPASDHAMDNARTGMAKSNQFWWPQQVDLSPLRQHGIERS